MKKDELEGVPEYIKEILYKIPKREEPQKNKLCPCGSGKKYKLCCYPKTLKEIDEILHNKRREELIRDIQKKIKDDSYMLLDVDRKLICLSTTYGPYETKEWALYFSKNNKKIKDEKFVKLFLEIEDFLYNLPEIIIRINRIVDQDTGRIKEFEILFMAQKKEYVIELLKKTDLPIDDTLGISNIICLDIGYRIHEFLLKKGITSFYPKRVYDLEHEKEEMIKEPIKDFIIELRSAQKLLYMSTIIKDIISNCDSPIEKDLGIKMAEENIPFIQQVPITDKFPDIRGNIITKPDFLILDPILPIAIYCDGYDFHDKKPEDATRDKRIDRILQQMGFVILRFTGQEIKYNIERCIEEIKTHFLGKEFAKTPNYILQKKLATIYPKVLNKWEKRFYESMWDYFKKSKPVTIKQEKTIYKLIHKTNEFLNKKSNPH